MRLASLLDSFSVLGSLWGGGLTGPQVCPWLPAAAVTAFVNVNVVPMDQERVLPRQTVLVQDGKIRALGPTGEVRIPVGAVRVDGRGQYLIPGLTDMHHHLWAALAAPGVPSERFTQDSLFLALAGGVTAVRFLDDQERFTRQQWRDVWQKRPEVLMPHVYFALYISDSIRADSAVRLVAAAKAAGYDFIKLTGYSGPPSDPRNTMQKSVPRRPTADEFVAVDSILAAARRAGLPVASHDVLYSFEQIIRLGTAGGSFEHSTVATSAFREDSLGLREQGLIPVPPTTLATMQRVAVALQRAGVWLTPTLQCTIGRPGREQLTKALQDGGVKLLLSGDDGWTVHDELAAFVRAGLTPYQALVTGTRHPAEYFGKLDEVGTVAVGKRADLVLLSGNPLTDIRHTREPVGVMANGRWLDRAELDRRLLAWKSSGLHTNDPARLEPHPWLVAALNNRGIAGHRAAGSLVASLFKLAVLVDSLGAVPAAEKRRYEPLMQRVAAELGAVRAELKQPAQQERFDVVARVWLREHARQGYQVAVHGVAPTP